MIMKRFYALAILPVMALLLGTAAPATAIEIQEVVSPGGVIAWLVEDHSVPLVSVEFEFKGGASSDPDDLQGLAYLASGLLNEGAGDMDAKAFQTRLDDLAIRLYFDAGADHLSGSMRTLSENAEDAFELLGMSLTIPRFDQDAIDRVRQQIWSIQRREAEQTRSVAAKAWMKTSFGDHPYGKNRKGTADSIGRITQGDLRSYTQKHLALDNVIIGVVGDIDAETLGEYLDAAFAELPEEAQRTTVAQTTPAQPFDIQVIERDVPQSAVVFGTKGIKRSDQDWYTALLVNYTLGGGGFSSRLMEEVRRKRGLAYGVSTYLAPREHVGLFMGSVATQNARVGESITVIRDEINRMATDGLTAQEMADAKTYLTGSYPLRFDTSGAIAGQLVGIQRYGLGMNYVDRRNDYINAIGIEQVNRVAQRILREDKLLWVIVGKPEGLPDDMRVAPTSHPAPHPDPAQQPES
jgi:zinc protease